MNLPPNREMRRRFWTEIRNGLSKYEAAEAARTRHPHREALVPPSWRGDSSLRQNTSANRSIAPIVAGVMTGHPPMRSQPLRRLTRKYPPLFAARLESLRLRSDEPSMQGSLMTSSRTTLAPLPGAGI